MPNAIGIVQAALHPEREISDWWARSRSGQVLLM